MEQSPPWETNRSSDYLRTEFKGTGLFFTAFTSARRLSLSCARSIQSMPPHPTSWRPFVILLSHLRLGLPSGIFPQAPPSNSNNNLENEIYNKVNNRSENCPFARCRSRTRGTLLPLPHTPPYAVFGVTRHWRNSAWCVVDHTVLH